MPNMNKLVEEEYPTLVDSGKKTVSETFEDVSVETADAEPSFEVLKQEADALLFKYTSEELFGVLKSFELVLAKMNRRDPVQTNIYCQDVFDTVLAEGACMPALFSKEETNDMYTAERSKSLSGRSNDKASGGFSDYIGDYTFYFGQTFRSYLLPVLFEALGANPHCDIQTITRRIHQVVEQVDDQMMVMNEKGGRVPSSSVSVASLELYPILKSAVQALNGMLDRENVTFSDVDMYLDTLQSVRAELDGMYSLSDAISQSVVSALEKTAKVSIEVLLKRARSDKKQASVQAEYYLHRVELGKIGITDKIVTYFDVRYTLDSEKDFVEARRLTTDGKVGLFDSHGKLEGFFELGVLNDPSLERQARVLAITREMLFADPATPDSILQQFLFDYKDFFERIYGDIPGGRMNDLSLREQCWVYQFWKQHPADWPLVQQLQSLGGSDAVRVLVAFEGRPRMLETIQTALSSASREEVKDMFAQYAHVVRFAQALGDSLGPSIDMQTFVSSALSSAGKEIFELSTSLQMGARGDTLTEVIHNAVIMLVNQYGDVRTRELLDAAIVSKKPFYSESEVNNALSYAYTLITPVEDKEAIRDLERFYSHDIAFEQYEVNKKMNERELQRIRAGLQEGDRVLDLGAGTGRLAVPLFQQGVAVDALDYSARHVSLLQEQTPSMRSIQADWKHTPLEAGTYDTIYSLGRNILHETSLVHQQELFVEANRLLKDGGVFVIDIPDRTVGGYKVLCDKYIEVMKQRGIVHTRYGTIYDSPDDTHFATRYAYSVDDIRLLAHASGFEIESVEKEYLATGKDDFNIYITLRKTSSLDQDDDSFLAAAE
jgi:SAM-dependent methyltransferase